MKGSKDGPLDPWFDLIRDVAKMNRRELESLNDVEERYHRLVELNVEAQCRNVLKLEVVRESILHSGMPTVHGWILDIRTGVLKDLEFQY